MELDGGFVINSLWHLICVATLAYSIAYLVKYKFSKINIIGINTSPACKNRKHYLFKRFSYFAESSATARTLLNPVDDAYLRAWGFRVIFDVRFPSTS